MPHHAAYITILHDKGSQRYLLHASCKTKKTRFHGRSAVLPPRCPSSLPSAHSPVGHGRTVPLVLFQSLLGARRSFGASGRAGRLGSTLPE